MAAFPGWITAVLLQLGAPNTKANQTFLTQWHLHEQSTCKNNPLNTTLHLGGSTNCVHVSGATYVQAYPTAAAGTTATVRTIEESRYADIVKALKTGNPFAVFYAHSVADELRTWGSTTFASWYLGHLTGASVPTPPAPRSTNPPTPATRATAAWRQMLKALDTDVPASLRQAGRIRARILHR